MSNRQKERGREKGRICCGDYLGHQTPRRLRTGKLPIMLASVLVNVNGQCFHEHATSPSALGIWREERHGRPWETIVRQWREVEGKLLPRRYLVLPLHSLEAPGTPTAELSLSVLQSVSSQSHSESSLVDLPMLKRRHLICPRVVPLVISPCIHRLNHRSMGSARQRAKS